MRRALLLLTICAVAGAGIGTATTAQASDICVTVQATGKVPLYQHKCVPYQRGVVCVGRDAGLDPTEHVYLTVCAPS